MDRKIRDILRDYPPTMKSAQVCKVLQIHRKTLYKLIRNGEVSASMVGNSYRITKESVGNYWTRMKKKGMGENESENR